MSAWDISGLEPAARGIVDDALKRCDFNFDVLLPKLRADTGRPAIPVEFADLSRYAMAARTSVAPGAHGHDHSHDTHSDPGEDPDLPDGLGHVHLNHPIEGGAHGVSYRKRVLGLAWYSGKVSVERSLVSDPDLAKEVFLCEGAHMVDFFWMSDEHRNRILEAYGAVHWFEEKGEYDYEDWTGESFMIGFTRAFSDVPVRFDQFTHQTTPAVAAAVREILRDGILAPPAPPEPPPTYDSYAFGVRRSRVYHLYDHWYVRRASAPERWASAAAATADGRRICYFCKRKLLKAGGG